MCHAGLVHSSSVQSSAHVWLPEVKSTRLHLYETEKQQEARMRIEANLSTDTISDVQPGEMSSNKVSSFQPTSNYR